MEDIEFVGDNLLQLDAEDKQLVVGVAEGMPHLLEAVVEADVIVVGEPNFADKVD